MKINLINSLKEKYDEGELSLVDVVLRLSYEGIVFTPTIGSEKSVLSDDEVVQFGIPVKRGFYTMTSSGGGYFKKLYARVGIIYENKKLPVVIWLPEVK